MSDIDDGEQEQEQEQEEDYAYPEDGDDEDMGEYEYQGEIDAPELVREASYPDAFRVPDGAYNVLEYRDMIPLLNAMVKEARTVLGMSADDALILLSHYGWNKERLFDTYWADTEACLHAAGLSCTGGCVSGCASGAGAPPPLPLPLPPLTCSVCYDDDIAAEDRVHLGCGHTFCR
jgi:hypothetical protein